MTLPVSPNTITMGMVNTELGLSATAPISLNDAAVRTLFGKPGSGTAISMSDGHGKSNVFTVTATGSLSWYNLEEDHASTGFNRINDYGFPAFGTISVAYYKGFLISGLYQDTANLGSEQTYGLVLHGNTSAALPSITFLAPADWAGVYTAAYSVSTDRTFYTGQRLAGSFVGPPGTCQIQPA